MASRVRIRLFIPLVLCFDADRIRAAVGGPCAIHRACTCASAPPAFRVAVTGQHHLVVVAPVSEPASRPRGERGFEPPPPQQQQHQPQPWHRVQVVSNSMAAAQLFLSGGDQYGYGPLSAPAPQYAGGMAPEQLGVFYATSPAGSQGFATAQHGAQGHRFNIGARAGVARTRAAPIAFDARSVRGDVAWATRLADVAALGHRGVVSPLFQAV
ncbi:hypothetical protein B0H14DRAFT_3427823 [Mycena olivaceomarginata]|nr:hypothetical protein B0H14DRAFT_3427823 [Mycena olivaceomarginata]